MLLGSSCHAATGARLVTWRQPGGWGMKSLIASTAPFRPEPDGCNRAAVSLAPSESVPRGTRAVSPPRAVRWALLRRTHPAFTPSRATSDPTQRVSACQKRPPDLPASRAFAPRSAKLPPPRHSVRPGTDPDPGPRLCHWGLRHWPTLRESGSRLEGTCSVHIDRRKNDTLRMGLRVAGLTVHASGLRQAGVAGGSMPPLFPLTRFAQGGVMVVTDRPCSRQQASDWIPWAVSQAGGDSNRFSGTFARKGCISTAIEAGVDEAILHLQSGHGQASRPRVHAPHVDRPLPRNV